MKNKLLYFSALSFCLLLFHTPLLSQNISDFQVNEYTGIDGSEQQYPSCDGNGHGHYIITWMDNRNGTDHNIFAQIFLNDSTPLNNNFIVNDDVGTYPQYNSSVAIAPGLEFVITWLDRRNGFEWDVYAQRYSGDGTPLGGNFKVNVEPDNEEQVSPSVSVDSCGNFVIVWADEKSGEWDIYGQQYLADGTVQGENFKINDDIGNEGQYWPTCELAKNGNFIVAWCDKRSNPNYDIYAQLFLPDGTPTGNNFKVNTDAGDFWHIKTDISMLDNGNFIIVWGDKRYDDWNVYAQMYMSDGTTIGNNFMVNDDIPDSKQIGPTVSADLAGNFVVCWVDDRNEEYDIYAQRFTADATPVGENFQINSDTSDFYHNHSSVSMEENGNFFIAWEDRRFGYNGDIFAQYYSFDGTATGDNFQVNDNINDANQTSPGITKSYDDNFIITWVENRSYSCDFYAQIFSGDGTPLGDDILVNDENQNYSSYGGPSVSADASGNFVVAWDDYRYEYWGEIYAQRFASDGTSLDSNFKVNFDGYNVVYGSKVACQKNGDFIVVWGDAEDGSKYPKMASSIHETKDLSGKFESDNKNSQPDVWVQRYLNDGTPMGNNLKVNDDENDSEQTNPAIAIDSAGNYIIAWNDNRNGNWDIFVQRYLSDGTAVDSNIKIIESLNLTYPTWPSMSSDNEGNFIITWVDNPNESYDIWGQLFSSNCLPAGDVFLVNDDTTNAHQSDPSVSIDDNGNFVISWFDRRNNDHDVYAQRYLSGGIPLGTNYRISNTGDMYQLRPSVVLDNNRIFSTWQDNRGGQSGYDVWANVYGWDSWVAIHDNYTENKVRNDILHQNFPNPFRLSSEITYSLDEQGYVTLEIYDLQGRKIKSLVNKHQPAKTFSVTIDGTELNSGIYFYKLNVGAKYSEAKKMIILR